MLWSRVFLILGLYVQVSMNVILRPMSGACPNSWSKAAVETIRTGIEHEMLKWLVFAASNCYDQLSMRDLTVKTVNDSLIYLFDWWWKETRQGPEETRSHLHVAGRLPTGDLRGSHSELVIKVKWVNSMEKVVNKMTVLPMGTQQVKTIL